MAVLKELISELTVLIEPLTTVLTPVLKLDIDEIAPLKELLIALMLVESGVSAARAVLRVAELLAART
jgi:hypothetical protein